MDINIRFVIDAPQGWKRRMLLYVATPLALVTAVSAVAYAYDTSWIGSTKPVSASALKTNLDEIQKRLEGSVCGGTSMTFTGMISATAGISGYKAAHDACVTACGIPSAHMCTASEVTGYLANGGSPGGVGVGWVSTGATFGATPGLGGDCQGYTDANPSMNGPLFVGDKCAAGACNSLRAIICCE